MAHSFRESQHRRRDAFTLIELVVVIVIIVILIALLIPAVRHAHPDGERNHCRNNLKQIGLALHLYHDVYGSFPPAYTVNANGRRLHSWRTLILPYLEQQTLYEQIDLSKPWDDPANADVFKTRIPAYQCPSADLPQSKTTYVAVVGRETCFPGAESRSLSEITDDTSETVIAFETDAAHAVNWMEPIDADEKEFLAFGKNPDALTHTGGTIILRADGSIWFVSQDLPEKVRRALLTIAGGEDVPDDSI